MEAVNIIVVVPVGAISFVIMGPQGAPSAMLVDLPEDVPLAGKREIIP